MKISVLGSGGWGTALAVLLHSNGHEVTIWSAFPEEAERLGRTRENPFLKNVRIPEGIEISGELSCADTSEIVVLAPPSFAVRDTAAKIAGRLSKGAVLVSVSKGIERETLKRLSEVIEDETGGMNPVVALSGPSHAEEVGCAVPTACVAACADIAAAELVQDVFMNERFRVYSSHDIIGVEIGAALKNVIAMCTGICDGMEMGDNTKAMLMTRGLTEMARLGVKMGGLSETFAGLTGVGDLIVTCTSMHSRNRRAGILIGRGMGAREAMNEVGAVVEGYYAADAAVALAEKYSVEMPIATEAYNVLYNGKTAAQALFELMTRSKKHEIEKSWVGDK